jgi:hypothetical protein
MLARATYLVILDGQIKKHEMSSYEIVGEDRNSYKTFVRELKCKETLAWKEVHY